MIICANHSNISKINSNKKKCLEISEFHLNHLKNHEDDIDSNNDQNMSDINFTEKEIVDLVTKLDFSDDFAVVSNALIMASRCADERPAAASLRSLAFLAQNDNFRLGNFGTSALVRVIRKHFQSATVCLNACGALLGLLKEASNKFLLVNLGICSDIVLIIKSHATKREDIAGWALSVVLDIADDNDTNRSFLGQAGACEAILDTMLAMWRNDSIARLCCAAIRNLSTAHTYNALLFEKAGVESKLQMLVDKEEVTEECQLMASTVILIVLAEKERSKLSPPSPSLPIMKPLTNQNLSANIIDDDASKSFNAITRLKLKAAEEEKSRIEKVDTEKLRQQQITNEKREQEKLELERLKAVAEEENRYKAEALASIEASTRREKEAAAAVDKSSKLPDKISKLHYKTSKLSDDSSKLPVKTSKLSDDSSKLPDKTSKLSDDSSKLPDNFDLSRTESASLSGSRSRTSSGSSSDMTSHSMSSYQDNRSVDTSTTPTTKPSKQVTSASASAIEHDLKFQEAEDRLENIISRMDEGQRLLDEKLTQIEDAEQILDQQTHECSKAELKLATLKKQITDKRRFLKSLLEKIAAEEAALEAVRTAVANAETNFEEVEAETDREMAIAKRRIEEVNSKAIGLKREAERKRIESMQIVEEVESLIKHPKRDMSPRKAEPVSSIRPPSPSPSLPLRAPSPPVSHRSTLPSNQDETADNDNAAILETSEPAAPVPVRPPTPTATATTATTATFATNGHSKPSSLQKRKPVQSPAPVANKPPLASPSPKKPPPENSKPNTASPAPAATASGLYEEAIALVSQHRLPEAISCFRAALSHDKSHVESYVGLATLLQTLGETAPAEQFFRRALSFRPDCAEAHSKLGDIYISRKQRVQGLVCYRNAVKFDGDNEDHKIKLGRVLLETSQCDEEIEEAIGVLQSAVVLNKENPSSHYYLGCAYQKLSNFGDAVLSLEEALLLDPAKVEVQLELGKALLSLAESLDEDSEIMLSLFAAYEHFVQLVTQKTDISDSQLKEAKKGEQQTRQKLKKLGVENL